MQSGKINYEDYGAIKGKINLEAPQETVTRIKDTDNDITSLWIAPILKRHASEEAAKNNLTWEAAYRLCVAFDKQAELLNRKRKSATDEEKNEMEQIRKDLADAMLKLEFDKKNKDIANDVHRIVCIYQGLYERALMNDAKLGGGLYKTFVGISREETWRPYYDVSNILYEKLYPDKLLKYLTILERMKSDLENFAADSVIKYDPIIADLLKLTDEEKNIWKTRWENHEKAKGSITDTSTWKSKFEQQSQSSTVGAWMLGVLTGGLAMTVTRANVEHEAKILNECLTNKIQIFLPKLEKLNAFLDSLYQNLEDYRPQASSKERRNLAGEAQMATSKCKEEFKDYDTSIQNQAEALKGIHKKLIAARGWLQKEGTLGALFTDTIAKLESLVKLTEIKMDKTQELQHDDKLTEVKEVGVKRIKGL